MSEPTLQAVETYFKRMVEIRSTGGATSETSFYSALETLINDLGRFLKPNVICNGQLKNQGAGHPDFGLYSKTQCAKGAPKPGQGETPERGIIEVKPLSDDSWQTAKGKQATKYFDHYRLVLITNYREFRLIGEDENGKAVERDYFSLADNENEFWVLASAPVKTSRETGAKFSEFLRRVMLNAAPLRRPEDIAWFLASYARDALDTLEGKDASALSPLRSALETALGIKFEGEKGEHFFRSTLVQTLFYGIFSAWVIWARSGGTGKYDWRSAGYQLTVPMIRSLFEEVAKPSRLAPLGVMNTLDRTAEALDRVDQTEFFKTFDSGQAVQHFYEPFLEAFDPDLRKEMGVWYTPPEIVNYMVTRVDTVLRSELGIADGLADKNVYVLDPCCGTGAFVVEVLRKIEETLRAKGDDALIGEDIKEAALQRVLGFEIMSAPFVIAHWQISNLLMNLGASIDPALGQRPAIYLTNALTGWGVEPKKSIPLFPELADERDQAEHVKRDTPILVVIGNPPYNAFAGTSPDEEEGLVDHYKDGLIKDWGVKKFNLDELYARFLRVAERKIGETAKGIVCYISSYSYISDPSFVVARKSLLSTFDEIWVDSLNGDSRETGKKTPEGLSDPSVFSTQMNRAGIRLGTCVGLFLKRETSLIEPVIKFRDFWGNNKRQELIDSLSISDFYGQYVSADPQDWNKLSFRPMDVTPEYLQWPTVADLASIAPINGLMEKRGGTLIDIDKAPLESRMKTYFNASTDWAGVKLVVPALAKDAARYDAEQARKRAISEATFDPKNLVSYTVRPFDTRHAYYTDIRPIWNECRPQLWAQLEKPNEFLMTRPSGVANPEGPPIFYTRCLGDNDAQRGHAYYIPFTAREAGKGMLSGKEWPNISKRAEEYLTSVGLNAATDPATSSRIWQHVLAVGYSPLYLSQNKNGIAIDWPRIPLPTDAGDFENSADLGARVAEVLDTENGADGVTTGNIPDHLKTVGGISAANLRIDTNWGYKDSQGRIIPARGKWETRAWTDAERNALASGFAQIGLAEARGFELLGGAVDVYLNEHTFWRGVPEAVWDCVIGGYQVIKKWLSYREFDILGRDLTKEEAREVTAIVRRLSALILLRDDLDASYAKARDNSFSWNEELPAT